MPTGTSFSAVVDQFSQAKTPKDSREVLERIRDQFGLAHVVYFAERIPGVTNGAPLIAVTYTDEWVEHYKTENFVEIDPVVPAGLRNILPTDWSTFDRKDSQLKRFFGEADDFGVGTQGITIPARSSSGDVAMLSVTGNMPPKEWSLFRKYFIREFQIIAAASHDMILRVNGANIEKPRLSPREIECLKWASEGKTYDDIATIMNISRGTVKSYMEMTRSKLNALNTTHTVTRAIRLGII